MTSNKKVTCPICKERLISLEGLYDHLLEDHENEIPEDYSAARYYYLLRTGKEHGSCVVCKNDTEWNDATNKYKRFCNNPKCKERYREMFKSRMVNKYGKTTLLDDPDQQRKMLANRKISGVYKWSDGKSEKTYTGSYELDFLTMLDKFMGFDADDIMSPSPHTYHYKFDGENKFYIPDFYIPSLNLEIEVKDGGVNPNTHSHMERDRKKERLKDDVMNRQKNVDYIKIIDKNYDNFFNYLLGKKEEVITESYSILNELTTKSKLDNNFNTKNKLKLSSFKRVPINEQNIKVFIDKCSSLKHLRLNKDYSGFIYFDDDKEVVAYIHVNTDTKTAQAIEVLNKYRGHGLSKQLIDVGIKDLDMDNLSVNKNNEVAINLYKKCGFSTYKETDKMLFMKLKKSIIESSTDIILESLNNIPELNTPKDISKWMQQNIRYSNFIKLKSPQEVIDSKSGDCHSQVNLIVALLRRIGISSNKLFFIEYNDTESTNAMTHTLVWYKDHGKIYWIENAWGGMEGIHGPYNNLSDLKNEIINMHKRMPSYKRYPKLEFRSVGKVEYGCSLQTYVSSILELSYQPLIDFLNENYIEPEEIMTEGNALYDKSHKFPIFIVLMHSGTLLANAIKKVTGDEFSHACISFNIKLTPLYSFGRKDLDMKQTGFVANSPKSSFFTKFKAKYAVYVMFVDRISLKKMQDRLKFFIQHDDELKYDIVALIRNFFGLQSENERKYFCSRFVADIINAGKQLERLPSMYRPQDFNNFDDIEKVDEGEDFYQYDYKKVEKNIRVIKKRDE